MNNHLMVPYNFFSVYWKSNIIYYFFQSVSTTNYWKENRVRNLYR